MVERVVLGHTWWKSTDPDSSVTGGSDSKAGRLQVDPTMKPTLKAPLSKRLNLEHDNLLSDFAFSFNLRRYSQVSIRDYVTQTGGKMLGRGLHSSTFRLNVSTFCGIRWVHHFPPVY